MKKLFKKKVKIKKNIRFCANTTCHNYKDGECKHKKDLLLCDGFIMQPVKAKAKVL